MSGDLDVRPYFATRMATIGYTEWTDEFNIENVPSTRLESIYFLENFEGDLESMSHNVCTFNIPAKMRLFIIGKRDPKSYHTAVMDKIALVMRTVCAAIYAENATYIKFVKPQKFQHGAINELNDNTFMIEINFNCLVCFDVNQ